MNPTALITVAIIIGAILGAVAAYIFQRYRSLRLSQRFGPEYSRTIAETGSQWKAEAALELRAKRVRQLHVRPLDPSERKQFLDHWRELEGRFVANPNETLVEADRLISRVMSAEGYPVLDFEQQAADVSVDHAAVVESYREGHRIAVKHAQGRANTEDLRLAMLQYRAFFEELVGPPEQTSPQDPLPAASRQ
jgi:hypothetical protein